MRLVRSLPSWLPPPATGNTGTHLLKTITASAGSALPFKCVKMPFKCVKMLLRNKSGLRCAHMSMLEPRSNNKKVILDITLALDTLLSCTAA